MSPATDMLARPARAGVYLASAAQLQAAEHAAMAIGFDSWSLDVSNVQTAPSLLRHIGQALRFPAWYGENWDALADCLTDLSWSEAEGFVLAVRGSDALRTAQPELWQTLVDLLNEVSDFWRDNQIAFWVLVEGNTDTLPAFPQSA
ncbi:barstar family protein [Uliginosibacterium sp. H3]|uniref:Barstar family protein n=1 Tax=Uliginosibacterium silvisoli TaxID=3114758 RepID=A0ABU6K6Y3_9RHOO|nr:barstar family protein [Uliginosibacterium sp. H3]